MKTIMTIGCDLRNFVIHLSVGLPQALQLTYVGVELRFARVQIGDYTIHTKSPEKIPSGSSIGP